MEEPPRYPCGVALPEAPTFCPTEAEFENPLRYILSIREEAEKFGICCIKPPPSWKPPFMLDLNKLKFPTRVQKINELLVPCPLLCTCVPCQPTVFRYGIFADPQGAADEVHEGAHRVLRRLGQPAQQDSRAGRQRARPSSALHQRRPARRLRGRHRQEVCARPLVPRSRPRRSREAWHTRPAPTPLRPSREGSGPRSRAR